MEYKKWRTSPANPPGEPLKLVLIILIYFSNMMASYEDGLQHKPLDAPHRVCK